MDLLARELAAKAIDKENISRRKMRQSQVREQSHEWMERNRKKYQEEKDRQIKMLTEALTADVQAKAIQNIDMMEKIHDLCAVEVGSAHRAAANLPNFDELKSKKHVQNSVKAINRGHEALMKEKQMMEKAHQEARKLQVLRENVRKDEDFKFREFAARNVHTTRSQAAVDRIVDKLTNRNSENKHRRPEYQPSLAKSLRVPKESNSESKIGKGKKSEKRLSKRKLKNVTYYDSAIPQGVLKYPPPPGLVHKHGKTISKTTGATTNAFDIAKKVTEAQRKKEEKVNIIQTKREQEIEKRGKTALKVEKLQRQLKEITNELQRGGLAVDGKLNDSFLGLSDVDEEEEEGAEDQHEMIQHLEIEEEEESSLHEYESSLDGRDQGEDIPDFLLLQTEKQSTTITTVIETPKNIQILKSKTTQKTPPFQQIDSTSTTTTKKPKLTPTTTTSSALTKSPKDKHKSIRTKSVQQTQTDISPIKQPIIPSPLNEPSLSSLTHTPSPVKPGKQTTKETPKDHKSKKQTPTKSPHLKHKTDQKSTTLTTITSKTTTPVIDKSIIQETLDITPSSSKKISEQIQSKHKELIQEKEGDESDESSLYEYETSSGSDIAEKLERLQKQLEQQRPKQLMMEKQEPPPSSSSSLLLLKESQQETIQKIKVTRVPKQTKPKLSPIQSSSFSSRDHELINQTNNIYTSPPENSDQFPYTSTPANDSSSLPTSSHNNTSSSSKSYSPSTTAKRKKALQHYIKKLLQMAPESMKKKGSIVSTSSSSGSMIEIPSSGVSSAMASDGSVSSLHSNGIFNSSDNNHHHHHNEGNTLTSVTEEEEEDELNQVSSGETVAKVKIAVSPRSK